MWAAFEIKGPRIKSSVSRLNLFKVLIVSSTSFLQGCVICSLDSSSSFSSFPSVITFLGCSENSKAIYSREKDRDWLIPSRKCTSRKAELNGSFLVRSFLLNSLRSLRYAFFLQSFWIQYTSNFLSCIIFKIIWFKTSGKAKKHLN